MAETDRSPADPSRYLDGALDIAARASGEIARIYDTAFTFENKQDDSPLTAADLASHEIIVDGLGELSPGIPVLSEESGDIPFSTRARWPRYWLIDPLDGTKEFIKRNGEFTVNIALIEGHEPVLGIVRVPATGICYYAARGRGAFRAAPGTETAALHTRPVTPGRLVAAGSRSHASDRQQRFFASLGENTEVIAAGSALKLCLVAEGSVDIYPRFGPTSEWDTAAAQCVVTEAGGSVTDLALRPLEYNRKESLLNPEFLVIGDPAFDWESRLREAGIAPPQEGVE